MSRPPAAKARPMVHGSQGLNMGLRVSRSIHLCIPSPIHSTRSRITLNLFIFKCIPVNFWAKSQVAYKSGVSQQDTFVCVQTLTLKKDAWAYYFLFLSICAVRFHFSFSMTNRLRYLCYCWLIQLQFTENHDCCSMDLIQMGSHVCCACFLFLF